MKYSLVFLALILAACASKKEMRATEPAISAEKTSSITFVPYPHKFNPEWVEPIEGAEGNQGRLELDPVSFLHEGNHFWLSGALKEGMIVRRSVLFHSADGIQWEELQPTSSSLAMVALAWLPAKGLVAIESLWTEGTYLVGAWVSDPSQKKWRNIIFPRKEEWSADPFRKELKCCSEMVNEFKITPKFWELDIEGTEKEARYRSSNQGKTWTMVKGSVRDLGASQVLNLGWKKVDWDGPVALVEIQAADKRFLFPKYWKFKKEKSKLILVPLK